MDIPPHFIKLIPALDNLGLGVIFFIILHRTVRGRSELSSFSRAYAAYAAYAGRERVKGDRKLLKNVVYMGYCGFDTESLKATFS